VHQYLNTSPALIHHHAPRRSPKSPFLHQLEKQWRVLAPGVGEQGLAARGEQPGDEVREGRGVPPLVEHVGGEDAFEGSEALRLRRVPVEERSLWLAAQVRPGVVGGEIEGGPVVVRRENLSTACEGDYGREADAAAELDGVLAGQVFSRQVPCQGYRARPEFGPVWEPLVALEVFLVQEGVRRGGMENAVGPASDLDEGFEQPGAAAEVRSEFI
jgi:hypothetical protein